MRALYEDFLAMAGRQLEFVELAGMENYELLLGIQPALPGLLKRKNDAISKADYETAASLRDQEKAYIRFMITQNGMNGDDNFFCHDEKIFFKTW